MSAIWGEDRLVMCAIIGIGKVPDPLWGSRAVVSIRPFFTPLNNREQDQKEKEAIGDDQTSHSLFF